MQSNLQKAISSKSFYCTINSEKSKHWRDFNLQPGHIYGYSPELCFDNFTGLFVVYQTRNDRIILRLAVPTRDYIQWHNYAIPMTSWTAKKILPVIRKREGGVVVDKHDISSFYKPQLTTDPYTPMPSMRIPMGKRGKDPVVKDSRNHDFSFKTVEEFHQKRHEQRRDNIMHTLDVRIHRATR